MTVEMAGKTVAVVGGGRRMLEITRQARAAGAGAKTYGHAPGAEEAAGLRVRTLGGDDALVISTPSPLQKGSCGWSSSTRRRPSWAALRRASGWGALA